MPSAKSSLETRLDFSRSLFRLLEELTHASSSVPSKLDGVEFELFTVLYCNPRGRVPRVPGTKSDPSPDARIWAEIKDLSQLSCNYYRRAYAPFLSIKSFY